jgi:hypothetical protein
MAIPKESVGKDSRAKGVKCLTAGAGRAIVRPLFLSPDSPLSRAFRSTALSAGAERQFLAVGFSPSPDAFG